MRRPAIFVISPLSARIDFGPRFGLVLGSLLGALWAPRALKPLLEFSQEPSKALLEYFFSAREPSKSAPRALQEAKGRPNRFLTPPGGLQEPFRAHFGAISGSIFEHFWNDFGAILRSIFEHFWNNFGAILKQRTNIFSPLLACSSRAPCVLLRLIFEHFLSSAGVLLACSWRAPGVFLACSWSLLACC